MVDLEKRQIKVARVLSDTELVLNVGSEAGVSEGMRFVVYRLGAEIVDPDTQESLGKLETVIGYGAITHVQPRMSTLTSTEVVDGGRKIVKRSDPKSSFSAVLYGLSGSIEETVEIPDKVKPFAAPKIGDLAKGT